MQAVKSSALEQNRETAVKAMQALFENHFDSADSYFHPQASWWIIGQGDLSHEAVRALAHKTEGGHTAAKLTILGTVAEANKVCVEARGNMTLQDGRPYQNTYHHMLEFKDGLIYRIHEYFDTAYVRKLFGETLYNETATD